MTTLEYDTLAYLKSFLSLQDELLAFVNSTVLNQEHSEEFCDEWGNPNNPDRQPGSWTTSFINYGGCKEFENRLKELNAEFAAKGVSVRDKFIASDAMTGRGCWYNSSCF